MNRFLYLSIFIAGIALSQTIAHGMSRPISDSSQSQSPQATVPAQVPTPNQTTPGSSTQPGNTNPQTSPGSAPGSSTDASGGGVAGAAGTASGKTQVPESPETPAQAGQPADGELQTQIQNALAKEPTLSGDTVNVSVTDEEIQLSGSVGTAREKQTATRIVQSYAGNKKVVSHLTVSGRNRTVTPNGANPKGH